MSKTAKILTPDSLNYYDQKKGYLNKSSADQLYMAKDSLKVTATKSGTVTTLTIKDSSGEHTTKINDGAKGDKGDKGDTGATGATGAKGSTGNAGADGFTPTVTASKSGTVTTLTITNKTGTSTVKINDGAKGDKGDTGATGAKGATGATGAKGADGVVLSVDTNTFTLSTAGKLSLNSGVKVIKSIGTGLSLSTAGALTLSGTVKAIKTGTAVPTTSTISSGEMYLQLES